MFLLAHDWREAGRKELEAQRDPVALYRMPMARYTSLFLVKPKHVWLAGVNAERKRLGLKPVPAHLV